MIHNHLHSRFPAIGPSGAWSALSILNLWCLVLNKSLRDAPESLQESTGSLSGSEPINSGCVENRFNLKISLCKYQTSKMAAGVCEVPLYGKFDSSRPFK